MLIRDGKTGNSVFLDFRENAPAAATPSMYTPKAPGSNYDKDLGNVYGGKAVAVPGDVAGLLYALEHSVAVQPVVPGPVVVPQVVVQQMAAP